MQACRMRWAELDAEQWSQGQTDASLPPAIYQVYLDTSCPSSRMFNMSDTDSLHNHHSLITYHIRVLLP